MPEFCRGIFGIVISLPSDSYVATSVRSERYVRLRILLLTKLLTSVQAALLARYMAATGTSPMEQQGDDDHENLGSYETPRDGDTMENTGRRKSVVTFAPSYDSDEMPLSLVDNETNNDETVQWKSDSRELTYSDVDLDDDVEAGQVPNDLLRQSLESPVRRKGNRRESMVRDLSTGKFGGGRAQSAQVRDARRPCCFFRCVQKLQLQMMVQLTISFLLPRLCVHVVIASITQLENGPTGGGTRCPQALTLLGAPKGR
jgi:hypothetical protein